MTHRFVLFALFSKLSINVFTKIVVFNNPIGLNKL